MPGIIIVLMCCLPLAAVESLMLEPALLRLDLQPADVVETTMTVRAPPGTRIHGVAVDCACIRIQNTLPIVVPEAGRTEIRLRITGIRPGIEDILVATDRGIVQAQIQIVGPGAGRGLDQLRAAAQQATASGWRLLGIAHQLRGQTRQCSCSTGALGGAGRMARMPGLLRELAPGLDATWVLSGDADGKRAGVGAALGRARLAHR